MKLSAFAAVAALCLAGFGGTAYAQQNSNASANSSDTNVIWVGSQEPSAPESAAAARAEAAAALHQARQDCRSEKAGQARNGCMKTAQDDHNNMMRSMQSSNRQAPRR